MQHDTDKIKRENDIVSTIGQFIELKRDGSGHKGCCPFHSERTPSFNVNPALQTYKCFGCDAGGDVIEFIKEYKKISFVEACEYLGSDAIKSEIVKTPAKIKKEKKPAIYESLLYNAAKDHYTTDVLQGFVDNMTDEDKIPKQYKKAWSYKDLNSDGEIVVELVAARFEDESGKKAVLSFYHNTHTIVMKNYPILLFNRDRLKAEPEKDVLIVFGEKCAEVADKAGFIGVTWNGGEKKVNEVDFSPLMGRTCWVWGDDDQKTVPAPKDDKDRVMPLLPQHKQPGTITIEAVKKHVPHVQVVEMPDFLREIEPDGADIADAVEYYGSADEEGTYICIAEYIYANSKRQEKPETRKTTIEPEKREPNKYPFEVLGIADDGKAYFIGSNDRLLALNPTSISRTQLMNLTDVGWWRDAYENGTKNGWEDATSDLIHISSMIDFDPERMRGRGAWREPDGRLCYHDGQKTEGEYSKDRIYLRRAKRDIGINTNHATSKQRRRIYEASSELTFETLADCIRTLGWSALAPFAGALPWRPAGLLTAASGSGKSTIVNAIIKPLAIPIVCSGGESSAAGIRQRIGIDSCSIVVEEAETDTQKKRQNRDETFSLMRQSTSDDSPDVLKGTIDGRGLSFTLRSMFFFVSISPEIDCEADENRTFRIGLEKAKYSRTEWLSREKELTAALTPEICEGVRAYTWSNLPAIIDLAERISVKAQIVAEVDNRTAFAESILIAAFMAVFQDNLNPSEQELTEFLKDFYKNAPVETRRNENEEMVERILDEVIQIERDRYTIRAVLTAIKTGRVDEMDLLPSQTAQFRREAGNYGVGLDPDGNFAIAKDHHKIMRIIEKGRGYHRQLERHPGHMNKGKYVGLGKDAGTKNCVIIEGVL